MKKPRVLLIFPPRWNAMAPYPAIPQLAGHLRARGVSVRAIDLNLLLQRWMLSTEGTRELVRAAKSVTNLAHAGSEEIADFANWGEVWLDAVAADHRRVREGVTRSESWTARDIHEFETIVSRSWDIIETLRRARQQHAGVPVPDQLFVARCLRRAMSWEPDIVGFSAVTQRQLLQSLEYSRALKAFGCDAKIVAGGSAVSSAFGMHFTEAAPPVEIDCVVVGPGEDALMQLVTNWRDGVPWPRRLGGGEPRRLGDGEPRSGGVSFPDGKVFAPRRYLRPRHSFPFPFSNGCRWRQCSFCGVYCTQGYRTGDPDKALQSLARLSKDFGCVSFFNTGAELAASDAANMSSALAKGDLRIRWQSMARADRNWTRQLCRRLACQGFEYVMFGIESLSDRILLAMGKGISAEEQIGALASACADGLKPAVSLIYDFPGETVEDLRTTLTALEHYVGDLSSLTLLRFHLDRTSRMAAHAGNYGIQIESPSLRSVYYDDAFQIEYKNPRRDADYLDRALRLFDHWIYAINRDHSILFTRQPDSVQLGFDLDFFFEGRHPTRERLDGYFRLDTILARRYLLDQTRMRSLRERAGAGGYQHKYLFQPIGPDTPHARVVQALERGDTVRDALDSAGASPDGDLGTYLALIQMVNGLDMLRVLVSAQGTRDTATARPRESRSSRTARRS